MRIISQNGNYDLNYENIFIEITGDTVYANGGTGRAFKMAKYSNRQKVVKSLDMLHDAYEKNQFLSRVVTGYLRTETEQHENIECFFDQVRESFVWQFPADEEVEV